MIKVAVNGFGRIGRSFYRALYESKNKAIELVAINDLGDINQLAHLLKYDTNNGRFKGAIRLDGNRLYIDEKPITVFQEKDPLKLPWADLGVDVVLESTGVYTDGVKAKAHLDAGAKKVLISAPAKNVDATIVYGVNNESYDKRNHKIISNASCTTNCLAPVAKVLNDKFGIVSGYMTTIHAFTQDQRLQDAPHKDMRRARAAAHNVIPTTTGAAKSIGLVIPELQGKMDGSSIRVPILTGSLVDLTVTLKVDVTVDQINLAMKEASEKMKGIFSYTEDEIVSSDIVGDSTSSIFDSKLTKVLDGRNVKVVAWYDNEWGFSNRLIDTISLIAG